MKKLLSVIFAIIMLFGLIPINVFASANMESDENPFKGKVISILGDSISTFAGYIPVADGFNLEHLARYPQNDLLTDVDETWWMQVISELEAKLGINDSWRGATVSGATPVTTGTTGENAAMSNLTRIQNLGANGTPDVILFYGGTNDLAHVPKVGSFNPDIAPTIVDLITKKWDNLAEAYVHTLLRLRHYYPNAIIMAMLPTYTKSYYSTNKLAQANAVLAQICDYYDVPYVDLRDCGITSANLPDGIHPDANGMDYITQAVLDALIKEGGIEPGENVVHSVTHQLTGAKSSLKHYKGVTHGKSFVTTITGEDIVVSVTMGDVDITDTVYTNGVVAITKVTGDIVITAEGKVKPIYEDYIQQLPKNICSETNLWRLLEHDKQYYTVNGWGIHSSNKVYSVTFPIKEGDQIFASSFGAAGTNGGTINGIRLTWFNNEGILKSLSSNETYAEFLKNGFLTAPANAVAVNVVMWNEDECNELYILNIDHTYENGACTGCDKTQPGPIITKQPESVETDIGEKFAINVEAKGECLTYQWYYKESYMNDFEVSSNKTSSYAYTMEEYRHKRQVYCVITDQYGNSVRTNTVTITRPPMELKIVKQPQNVCTEIGDQFAINVKAEGDGLTYQWYYKESYMKKFEDRKSVV